MVKILYQMPLPTDGLPVLVLEIFTWKMLFVLVDLLLKKSMKLDRYVNSHIAEEPSIEHKIIQRYSS